MTNDHLPLAVISAQGTYRLGEAERGLEQALGVQPLHPLAIEDIGLGTSAAAVPLARLDQITRKEP